MAFNYQSSAPAAQRSNNEQAEWKADGFINVSLPDGEGGFIKLGAIPLKCSDENHKRIYEWLMQDPERVGKLIEHCRIEFRSAQKKAVKFDLNALL